MPRASPLTLPGHPPRNPRAPEHPSRIPFRPRKPTFDPFPSSNQVQSAPVPPSRPVNAPWSAIVKSKPAQGGNPAAPADGASDGKSSSPSSSAAATADADAASGAKASKGDAPEKADAGNDPTDPAGKKEHTQATQLAPAKKAWGVPARNDAPITPPTWPTLGDAKDPSKKPADPPPVPPGPPPGAEDVKEGEGGGKKKGRGKKDPSASSGADAAEAAMASNGKSGKPDKSGGKGGKGKAPKKAIAAEGNKGPDTCDEVVGSPEPKISNAAPTNASTPASSIGQPRPWWKAEPSPSPMHRAFGKLVFPFVLVCSHFIEARFHFSLLQEVQHRHL